MFFETTLLMLKERKRVYLQQTYFFFEELEGQQPDQAMKPLEEVFHLD